MPKASMLIKMQGKQQAQKSRIALRLMRLDAKPDLEKTVRQAGSTRHPRS